MKASVYGSRLCLAFFSFVVLGCTTLSNSPQSREKEDASKIAEVLSYFHDVTSSSKYDLSDTYMLAEQQYEENKDTKNAVKLALLLTIPHTKFYNTSRAIDVLKSFISSKEKTTPIHNFSSLLLFMMLEQKNKEILYNMISESLVSIIEERDKNEYLYKVANKQNKHQESLYNELTLALDKEKERVESLQRVIEQLKKIEKILNKRKHSEAPAT